MVVFLSAEEVEMSEGMVDALVIGFVITGMFLFLTVLRSWMNDDQSSDFVLNASPEQKEMIAKEWQFQYKYRIITSIIGLVCFASAFGLCLLMGSQK